MRLTCVCRRPAVSTITTSKLFRPGLGAGVEGDAGRVAAALVLDNLAAQPLAPDGELLDGGGAEGVAGGHHHLLLLFRHHLASLAMDVVLPEPLTPATITTVGPLGANLMPSSGPAAWP